MQKAFLVPNPFFDPRLGIPMQYTREQIANALDLAVLKPTTTEHHVWSACELAKHHGIKSVCVQPCNVALASKYFSNVSTVIGFPLGSTSPTAKFNEARDALDKGARELDIVINYGRLLDHEFSYVQKELAAIVSYARNDPRPSRIKAIIETCYLSPDDIRTACRLCEAAGVDFVKTSTGFGPQGATPQAVNIIRDALAGTGVQIKASGGIHNYADACRFLDLGCSRLGSSKFKELLPR
jgi:deoxyribose-phosphate aldolase